MRISRIERAQKMTLRSNEVDALASVAVVVASAIVSDIAEQAEEIAFGVLLSLQPPNFVGGGHEFFR